MHLQDYESDEAGFLKTSRFPFSRNVVLKIAEKRETTIWMWPVFAKNIPITFSFAGESGAVERRATEAAEKAQFGKGAGKTAFQS